MSIIDEEIAQLSDRYVEAVEERIVLLKHAVSSEYIRCWRIKMNMKTLEQFQFAQQTEMKES